jgi:hypothetical protein
LPENSPNDFFLVEGSSPPDKSSQGKFFAMNLIMIRRKVFCSDDFPPDNSSLQSLLREGVKFFERKILQRIIFCSFFIPWRRTILRWIFLRWMILRSVNSLLGKILRQRILCLYICNFFARAENSSKEDYSLGLFFAGKFLA